MDESNIMYRIIHAEPFNDEVVALLDSSAMSETDFLHSAFAKDYTLDVSSTYVNGIKNKNILFELIGCSSSQPADKVRQTMLDTVKSNINEFKTHCKMALNLKGCTGEQWVQYMESNNYVNDELCLFILGKLYFRHATVLNKYNLWTTVAPSVRINDEALLKLSSIRLLYMGKQTFGILKPKLRLVMQGNTNRQPGYASNSIQRGRATRPYNIQPLNNQPMVNRTHRLPSFMDQPFERLTVPHTIQQRYSQPRALNTRQMPLPRPYSMPSSTYTPSQYTNIMTRRPAIRPQVCPRSLQHQQPPYHQTTSSLRGIQSVRPTHVVPTNRTGLMNQWNRSASVSNIEPQHRINIVSASSVTPRTLETPNRLSSNQTMSPEVSRLLQTLQNKNITSNTAIPTIDLVDTDDDNNTDQLTALTNKTSVVTTATAREDRPVTGAYAIDENELHYPRNVNLENDSLDTSVQDTSSNIISINPVSESGDDSTSELLNELNIDLTDLAPTVQAPETPTSVNVPNNGPIVAETDKSPESTGNVTCKLPVQTETNDAKTTKTTSKTDTEDLDLNKHEQLDSKVDIKPSIEALQIKVEKNLEQNTDLLKAEQSVNVKIENATKLQKFVDIPSILSEEVPNDSQLVVKTESDAINDDTPTSIDFTIIDEDMIKSLMASEAKKRNSKRKKKTKSNVAKKKTMKARTKIKKCTPLDRSIKATTNLLFEQLRDIKKEVKQEATPSQPNNKPKQKELTPRSIVTKCKPFSIILERLEIPDIEFKSKHSGNQNKDHDQLETSQPEDHPQTELDNDNHDQLDISHQSQETDINDAEEKRNSSQSEQSPQAEMENDNETVNESTSATSTTSSSDDDYTPLQPAKKRKRKVISSTSENDDHTRTASCTTTTSDTSIAAPKTKRSIKKLTNPTKRQHSTYQRKFKCSSCTVVKLSLQELNHHFRSSHRPVSCNICRKSFSTPCGLHKHMYIHKDKPFQCNECDKSYPFQSQLVSHQITHTNKLEFCCNHTGCGKEFKRKNEYEKHAATHDGIYHKCDHDGCDYKNLDVRNLVAHKKTHAPDVKNYHCVYCGEGFLHYSQRSRHYDRSCEKKAKK